MINLNEILGLTISDKYLQCVMTYQNKTIYDMSLINVLRILWFIKIIYQNDISKWYIVVIYELYIKKIYQNYK